MSRSGIDNAPGSSDDDPGSPLLEVNDLRTHFTVPGGVVRAVDGVSFSLDRGTTIGIVGESGSGKTVLSRSIMRLNIGHNVTTTGTVMFEGVDLLQVPSSKMRHYWGQEIAMIFQDPMTSLNPVVKVGRQITEHLRHHMGVSKSYAHEVGIELLRSVRIPEPHKRFNAYPHELSGGMRQRISIAIALACGPKLLIADEPTTALDVTVQHQILNMLNEQRRDRFMAMILVTHDLGVVAGRTDELIVMYAGKVVERGPTAVVFDNVKMPYTEALLRAIPRTSQPKHSRLSAIAGRPPDLINPPKGCSFSPRCPYAQDKCFHEEPPLLPAAEPGHEFACWFPVGTPEGRDALERNIAAERTQTMVMLRGETIDTELSEPVAAGLAEGAND